MRNPSSIDNKLAQRKSENAFRTLLDLSEQMDFFSNDYLGVAKNSSASENSSGSTGSRLMSGNSRRVEHIEQQLADFFGKEAGLVFNSGYDANVGLFSSVPQKGDTIIYDYLIHASIRDGIKLSNAQAFSFEHNDINALRSKLERSGGDIFVVVESVYSMDGDIAPVAEIAALCEEYGAFLIVDEAHSGGVMGEKGDGLVSELGLNDKVFAKLMTFGKAYGYHGGLILGSQDLRDYLINFSRSFMYTTALPFASYERILEVVQHVGGLSEEREKLKNNITLFRSLLNECPYEVIESKTPIQGVVIPGNEACKKVAQGILDVGIAVKAILYPTVPKGRERLRFCIHSYNSEQEIRELVKAIHG